MPLINIQRQPTQVNGGVILAKRLAKHRRELPKKLKGSAWNRKRQSKQPISRNAKTTTNITTGKSQGNDMSTVIENNQELFPITIETII